MASIQIRDAGNNTVNLLVTGDGTPGNPYTMAQPDSRETWRVSLIADEAANDSDKTLTVPAATEYQLLWIWVELATSADVGARQLEVQFLDAAETPDLIASVRAALTQAASLTYLYLFAPGVADLSTVRDSDLVNVGMPPIVLSAGQKVRVFDNNAVAVAADDMVIQMQVASRSVA